MDSFYLYDLLIQFLPQFIEFHFKGSLLLFGLTVVILSNSKRPGLIKFISSISIAEIIFFLPLIIIFQFYFSIPDTSGSIILKTLTFNISSIYSSKTVYANVFNFKVWLFIFYFFGLLFFTIRFSKQYLSLLNLTKSSEILKIIRINGRTVSIRISNYYHSPFTFGFFKPTVLLPKSYLQWSTEQKQYSLNHELTHIKQYDSVLNLFMSSIV